MPEAVRRDCSPCGGTWVEGNHAGIGGKRVPGGFDKERFRHNLNELLDAFSIGNTELARYLSYDASYLSRIRSGKRTPRDSGVFVRQLNSKI